MRAGVFRRQPVTCSALSRDEIFLRCLVPHAQPAGQCVVHGLRLAQAETAVGHGEVLEDRAAGTETSQGCECLVWSVRGVAERQYGLLLGDVLAELREERPGVGRLVPTDADDLHVAELGRQ